MWIGQKKVFLHQRVKQNLGHKGKETLRGYLMKHNGRKYNVCK